MGHSLVGWPHHSFRRKHSALKERPTQRHIPCAIISGVAVQCVPVESIGDSFRMMISPRRALLAFPALLCVLSVPPAPAMASPDPAEGNCSLIIHVTGFRNAEGVLGAELFTSHVGWPEKVDKSFRNANFPIEGDHATARFDHLPAGADLR